MIKMHYTVPENAQVPFQNNAAFCMGTGRMGLALQKSYHDQLQLVQSEINFSHIQSCSNPKIRTNRTKIDNHTLSLSYQLTKNALLYFEVQPIKPMTDRGYQPEQIKVFRFNLYIKCKIKIRKIFG